MAKLDDLIQQKQQRDEDWKSRKAAEREELGQLSDDAVMRVTSEPGAYLHYLDTQAINPRYSASNVMLAMAQNPEITYINSLEVWNRLGRSVNRDENGMKIRVSDTYVKDGREYHGYKIGRVFDVTQTHGKAGVPALSLKDNTPEMDAAKLNISPHQLSYVTQSAEGEGLLFYGSVILPFVDRFPKDTELYKIITTKLSEQVQSE